MTEGRFTGDKQNDDKLHAVRWFGENVFPQLIAAAVHRFGEDTIVGCINDGLIIRSESKAGSNPAMMKKASNACELSDDGWKLYQTVFQEPQNKQI